ncbi:PhnD/SsuA/transferrin family substrate-binding protein [Chelativorans sp.]|uniref:phosphate/phosphite/phosphonate ABC transporter substrate-binding protein n=1 Tax=Chelativorans sp. TaxID=2203393 RepID=UPI0028115642|nr:PhnD/SsuA/transferrin family substrate-binding protein [Chelativorans sp.]
MSALVAALPMYDWPEVRAETDAHWARLRVCLAERGIDAPVHLVRRNADLPAVLGGIRGPDGQLLAPDPATLPPDELDLRALWLHPSLLFAQCCWGPLELGLAEHVQVVGQPSYDGFEGGEGTLYSSAILMREAEGSVKAPAGGIAFISVDLLRGRRLAYNEPHSLSGLLALQRDLEAMGEGLSIFAERIETGSHRASLAAVAEGRADVCAVDCRAWALARRFEPAAARLTVVGWTRRRLGLPYITAKNTAPERFLLLQRALCVALQS